MVQPHSIIDNSSAETALEPVVGGSGTLYSSIASAIAGETESRVNAVVPQAGSGPGVIVGPVTLSPVDNFYKDWFVVNTDTTPSNGLVAQWARVSSYIGATRTLTIDKPWDFSAESDFLLVDPVRLTLRQDITEDVTVNKCAVMDLAGNRIKGKVDITASEFCWVRGGSGYVTNGIQKSDFGVLKVDAANVSRRDATIYALLLDSGSDLGRCELMGCEFFGRVSGRRGRSGWSIYECRNIGINDSVQGVPYTLVESVAGVAITLTQFDSAINGEFSGAYFYSENSITGATAYISIMASITPEKDYFGVTILNRRLAVARGVGGATLSFTATSGNLSIHYTQIARGAGGGSEVANFKVNFSTLAVQNFTGTANVGFSFATGEYKIVCPEGRGLCHITVEGASTMSGNVTLAGTATYIYDSMRASCFVLDIESPVTGTVTASTGTVLFYGGAVTAGIINAAQAAGTPTFTISSSVIVRNYETWTPWSIVAGTSVGTYLFSGTLTLLSGGLGGILSGSTNTTMTGGTITTSGFISAVGRQISDGAELTVIENNTTSPSLWVTSGAINIDTATHGQIFICQTTNSGLATVSGAVTIRNARCKSAVNLVASALGSSQANTTGAVIFSQCNFDGNVIILTTNNAAGSCQGPSSLVFEYCNFALLWTDRSGAGTFTWTGSSLQFKFCQLQGLITVTATSFTTFESFHTRFNGNSSNKALTLTGTRPTTLRYWKCSFAARFDDLQPEVLDVYNILPAQAALVQGQPVKINAADQYQVCVAASIVDGVALAAAGGAGTILIAVRQGRIYVTCKAGTVNGDNLVLDLVTPTQANQGAFLAGQEIGTALEAVGTVVAGKCYTAVNVR